jgi:putative addiction module component (TIGR02574 family)
MPMTLDQIVEETRHMPPDVVAELVDRILVARHGASEPDAAAAWKKEIGKRIEDIETGKMKGIPVEESLAKIRNLVKQSQPILGG